MFTDKLFDWAAEDPDHPFLLFEDRTISYGGMAELTRSCAGQLQAMGVKPGDRVAMLCGNRPAFLAVWFALSRLGAVAVPLNVALLGDGLRYVLTQSLSTLLLIEPELLRARHRELENLPLQVVTLDERFERTEPKGGAFETAECGAESPNCILYTSGTTGLPKGAIITHGGYEAAGRDMVRSLGLTRDDRLLVFLPLFHANPQMYAVASALDCGATLALLPKFSAGDLFAQARRYGATGFTYVGSVLGILVKRYPDGERDHGLKWCVGGGAPPLIWQALEERFGITVRELYGMTETGGWVSMNTAAGSRRGSVGLPRAGVEIRIVDEAGAVLPGGSSGEITARSLDPQMFFAGYWRKPEVDAETLRDGWLHTGDRGHLDEDGYLFFDGRLKDLIRKGGEMISPVEIETQLLKHPAVADCAAAPVEDDILGEEIKVVVVPSAPVEPAEIRAFLEERLPRHMLPRYLVFGDEIPKTETLKVQRHKLAGLPPDAIDLRPRAQP